MPAPNRGEVWIVDLGTAGKVRPCVVLSLPAGPQDRALVTLVAHTTSARGSNFEVAVRSRFLAAAGFSMPRTCSRSRTPNWSASWGAYHRINWRRSKRRCGARSGCRSEWPRNWSRPKMPSFRRNQGFSNGYVKKPAIFWVRFRFS